MNRFHVEFTNRAANEFNGICDWYEGHSTQASEKRIDAVSRMLDQLEADPHRFPRPSDDCLSSLPFQECCFGVAHRSTHRFVFMVRPSQRVVVYAIRHLAQRELSSDDL